MFRTVDGLARRAVALAEDRQRVLIGITGAPGAGKSALAARLVDRLAPQSVVVGMDGFHLAQDELARLGRADRKGASDTFDVGGYVALLHRLRSNADEIVYAPLFRREIEEPIAGAVAVAPDVRFVITEGNYLLLDRPGWRDVRSLLDEVWFLDVDPDERRQRLIRRRMELGATKEHADQWTFGSDEDNARTVASTRDRADLVVALPND